MAFTPEDGTGIPNANSYVDLPFADGYFDERNNSDWLTLTGRSKRAYLIAATDYIDMRWGPLFASEPVSIAQGLQFPRVGFVNPMGLPIIPIQLMRATCEYALRASVAPLAPDIEQDPSGFQVSRRMEKLGPIEERTDFAFLGPGAKRQILRAYPAADLLLAPFLRKIAGGRTIRN